MRATPAGDDHGGSFLSHPVSIQIEQFSCRMRKGIEVLDKTLKWVDSYFSIFPIPNSIDLLNVSLLNLSSQSFLLEEENGPPLPLKRHSLQKDFSEHLLDRN